MSGDVEHNSAGTLRFVHRSASQVFSMLQRKCSIPPYFFPIESLAVVPQMTD